MKQLLLSAALILTLFVTACELKDAETDQEECEKTQREFGILGIAQCNLKYTPGSAEYDQCVGIILISVMDNYVMCKKQN